MSNSLVASHLGVPRGGFRLVKNDHELQIRALPCRIFLRPRLHPLTILVQTQAANPVDAIRLEIGKQSLAGTDLRDRLLVRYCVVILDMETRDFFRPGVDHRYHKYQRRNDLH